jgi:hypothetical protein
MIAREEAIVGQAEVRLRSTPDQKRVVLVESKNLAGVWTGQNSEINLHSFSREPRVYSIV